MKAISEVNITAVALQMAPMPAGAVTQDVSEDMVTEDLWDIAGFVAFIIVLFELAAFCYIAYADPVIFPEVYDSATPDTPARPAREIILRGSTIPVALVEGLREIAPDGEPDAEKCLAMFQEAAFVMGAVTAANLFAEFETAPMDVRAGLANQLMLYFFEGMRVALEGGQT